MQNWMQLRSLNQLKEGEKILFFLVQDKSNNHSSEINHHSVLLWIFACVLEPNIFLLASCLIKLMSFFM